jgi:uncharacterized phage protein (TIGR01671 family)
MREIEFRGKISKNTLGEKGKWIFGCLVDTDMICARYKEPKKDGLTGEQAPVDPETVGQYTGLKDKNGVKIFEGDIIAWKQYAADDEITRYSIVKYGGTSFFFSRKSGHGNPDYPISYFKTELFEVIGNIHDNPELPNVK